MSEPTLEPWLAELLDKYERTEVAHRQREAYIEAERQKLREETARIKARSESLHAETQVKMAELKRLRARVAEMKVFSEAHKIRKREALSIQDVDVRRSRLQQLWMEADEFMRTTV